MDGILKEFIGMVLTLLGIELIVSGRKSEESPVVPIDEPK